MCFKKYFMLMVFLFLSACDSKAIEYKEMDIQEFSLEKENLNGSGVSITGFITVYTNLGVLDYPLKGEAVINLEELSLDERKILNDNCFSEASRCVGNVKGRVENIETRLGPTIGIVVVKIELQTVQGQPFQKD